MARVKKVIRLFDFNHNDYACFLQSILKREFDIKYFLIIENQLLKNIIKHPLPASLSKREVSKKSLFEEGFREMF